MSLVRRERIRPDWKPALRNRIAHSVSSPACQAGSGRYFTRICGLVLNVAETSESARRPRLTAVILWRCTVAITAWARSLGGQAGVVFAGPASFDPPNR